MFLHFRVKFTILSVELITREPDWVATAREEAEERHATGKIL